MDTRLSATRDLEAAEAFFQKAEATVGHKPERVTTDKHAAYPQAIQAVFGFSVVHRTNQYLNNRIEQDHRALKQRYYPRRGFKSFAVTARFCKACDEVRQSFRVRSASKQPLSLSLLRQHFRERCAAVLTAWQAA